MEDSLIAFALRYAGLLTDQRLEAPLSPLYRTMLWAAVLDYKSGIMDECDPLSKLISAASLIWIWLAGVKGWEGGFLLALQKKGLQVPLPVTETDFLE